MYMRGLIRTFLTSSLYLNINTIHFHPIPFFFFFINPFYNYKKMLGRSASKLFHHRRHIMALGAVATGGATLFMTSDKQVHAESNKLKFWQSLPGENTPENPGFAKLRGVAAEQRFRTSLAQNNGKTDFDVVIGKFVKYVFVFIYINISQQWEVVLLVWLLQENY